MGDFYYEDRQYVAFKNRAFNQGDKTAQLWSSVLAFSAGVYFVFKALDLLGFPVRLWVHMATEKIGAIGLRGRSAPSDNEGDDAHETMVQRKATLLNSVFGLNSSSFLQKGVQGVTGALRKGPSDAPPGLGNWDNSCYQNSVIQGLASLPTLREYLSKMTTEFSSLDTESTSGSLFDIIRKLNDPGNNGQHFWVKGKLKSMSTFQQQDAQEYYSKVLDALDKEVKSATTTQRRFGSSWLKAMSVGDPQKDTSDGRNEDAVESEAADAENSSKPLKPDPNPLDGLLAQRVGCIKCGYSEGLQLIPFNCITVSLGRSYAYDISDCLNEYTHLEYIEGVECAKCTLLKMKTALTPLAAKGGPFAAKLQAVEEALEEDDLDDKTLIKKFNILKKNWVKSTKSRQAVVARAPKALVLHVNRSIFDEMTGAQYKNTAAVTYPRILDIGSWCIGNQPSDSHLPDSEEWPRDPTKSMVSSGEDEMSSSPFQYQLKAAVTHFGTHGNGHYICYRPHPRKSGSSPERADEGRGAEQWWRFSDESVYAVPESQAHQGNVFMLFYELMDGSSSPPSEDQGGTLAVPAMEEDIPLPPADWSSSPTDVIDDTAADVPLPGGLGDSDDDDSLPDLISSPEAPTPPATASQPSTPAHEPVTLPDLKPTEIELTVYPSPPPESSSSTLQSISETSEADTEPSEADTEPSEVGTFPESSMAPSKFPTSPHLMRTAGQSPAREGNRSLPLVPAT